MASISSTRSRSRGEMSRAARRSPNDNSPQMSWCVLIFRVPEKTSEVRPASVADRQCKDRQKGTWWQRNANQLTTVRICLVNTYVGRLRSLNSQRAHSGPLSSKANSGLEIRSINTYGPSDLESAGRRFGKISRFSPVRRCWTTTQIAGTASRRWAFRRWQSCTSCVSQSSARSPSRVELRQNPRPPGS